MYGLSSQNAGKDGGQYGGCNGFCSNFKELKILSLLLTIENKKVDTTIARLPEEILKYKHKLKMFTFFAAGNACGEFHTPENI